MIVFSTIIKTWVLILLSFLVSWILMFLQLPTWFDWLRPSWVVLVLLYWVLVMPQCVNVGFAWVIGILLDIVYNVPIGENAVGLVLLAYIVVKFRQKIMLLGFWKMSIVIFSLIMLHQLLRFLMQAYLGDYFNALSILGSATISALVWPFLALLLFNCQKKFRL